MALKLIIRKAASCSLKQSQVIQTGHNNPVTQSLWLVVPLLICLTYTEAEISVLYNSSFI